MAKKRANGEGSLRKRSDGRWEGRYTAGHDPETGKAIYKNVLAKTQKECKEKLSAALELAGKIDASKTGQFTVGQWAETWFENYAKPSIRETTAAYYKNYIDKHIVPNIGKIKLNKLATLDIQKFYNKALRGHERPEPQQQNHPRPSRHAPPVPRPSSAGAADPLQPRRRV